MTEGFRNKCVPEKGKVAARSPNLSNPGATPGKLLMTCPRHSFEFTFYVSFLLGLTFSRKGLCYSLPVQDTSADLVGKNSQPYQGYNVERRKTLGTGENKPKTQKPKPMGSCCLHCTKTHMWAHTYLQGSQKTILFPFLLNMITIRNGTLTSLWCLAVGLSQSLDLSLHTICYLLHRNSIVIGSF